MPLDDAQDRALKSLRTRSRSQAGLSGATARVREGKEAEGVSGPAAREQLMRKHALASFADLMAQVAKLEAEYGFTPLSQPAP